MYFYKLFKAVIHMYLAEHLKLQLVKETLKTYLKC